MVGSGEQTRHQNGVVVHQGLGRKVRGLGPGGQSRGGRIRKSACLT